MPAKPKAKKATHEAFVITFWIRIGAVWAHDVASASTWI